MSELSVGTSSQFASSMQVPCSTVVSFTEAIWTCFTLSYVKVKTDPLLEHLHGALLVFAQLLQSPNDDARERVLVSGSAQ